MCMSVCKSSTSACTKQSEDTDKRRKTLKMTLEILMGF